MSDNKVEGAPETAAAETASKSKKIAKLNLAEIDKALGDCREKQGGLASKYARQLLARKKTLGSGVK